MSATLTTVKSQLEEHLSDLTNLIWSSSALEEAIRSSLAELSIAYGSSLTLNGLDGESATTFDDDDTHVLINGGLAYAVRFRVMGRFEEASSEDLQPEKMAAWGVETMHKFQSDLTMVKLRKFQESLDHPYTVWEWDEGEDFS